MQRRSLGLGSAIFAFVLLLTGAAPSEHPLLDAARRGDAAAVRTLLRQGADPNQAQGDGMTALHIVAETGNVEIARLLLERKANVNAKTRLGGYTPLHLASGHARTDLVSALLAAGADVNAVTTTGGATALHLAAKALDGEGAVKLLLEKGAAANAAEKSAGQTPLMFAASFGRTAAVRELLAHGADPAVRTEVVDVLQRLAVDRAAQQRLRQAVSQVRQETAGGTDRPLTVAEGQAAIAKQREFLGNQAEVAKTLEGFTPDQLARMRPSWNTPSGFQSEVEILQRPMIETLVGKTGGMTALLHAAREGRIDAAVVLLDGGAKIDQVSGDGSSPLVMALLNGHFDLAMELLTRGANPNLATYTDGISPLFAALQTQWSLKFTDHPQPRAQDNQKVRHHEVLAALLDAGADPNVRLKTHLWHLEWEGKFGIDITGATPFWRAAFAQDLEAMKLLAAHGADPNIPTAWPEPGMRHARQEDGRIMDDSGLPIMPEGTPNMYPIHAAAGGGYLGLGAFQQNNVPNNFLNAVQYLVEEHGADVNLPDSWGYTALHYAAARGGNDLVEYLASKGADVAAVSRLGQSAVDMARGGRAGYFSRTPYPQTVELLQKLGSPFKCLDTHFRGTGDFCPGAGVPLFEGMTDEGTPTP